MAEGPQSPRLADSSCSDVGDVKPEASAVSCADSVPLDVSYCPVCSFPHEFCEYSATYDKCKAWMKDNKPDLFEKLVEDADDDDDGDATAAACSVTVSSTPGLKGILKAPKTDEDYAAKSSSRRRVRWEPANLVSIGTMPRGKKRTTVVKGLASFGVDTKKASRMFSQKFACGVSTIEDQGLLIQGDVVDELIQLLKNKFKEVPSEVIRNVGEIKR